MIQQQPKQKNSAKLIAIFVILIAVFIFIFGAYLCIFKNILGGIFDIVYECDASNLSTICKNRGTYSLGIVAGILSFFIVFWLIFNFAIILYEKFCENKTLINQKSKIYFILAICGVLCGIITLLFLDNVYGVIKISLILSIWIAIFVILKILSRIL